MKNYFKKILAYFLTGSFTLILAACYGAPVEMQYDKTIKATDDSENPIQGLKVKLKSNGNDIDSAFTDEYGLVDFYNVNIEVSDYQVTISDVDAEENLGTFKDTTFNLESDNYYEIKMKN